MNQSVHRVIREERCLGATSYSKIERSCRRCLRDNRAVYDAAVADARAIGLRAARLQTGLKQTGVGRTTKRRASSWPGRCGSPSAILASKRGMAGSLGQPLSCRSPR